jgi:hypothetical protein
MLKSSSRIASSFAHGAAGDDLERKLRIGGLKIAALPTTIVFDFAVQSPALKLIEH